MTTYRVTSITPFNNGLKNGDLFNDKEGNINIPALLAAGRIAVAQSPPISEILKLANVAPKFHEVGVVTVQELIDADSLELAKQLGYRTRKPIERYQEIAQEALKAPEKAKRG